MTMWSMSYDLHSHSIHSDGELSVEDLCQLMNQQGVKVWSLTDHDTIAGWQEASSAASMHGIRFIGGVEITCERALEGSKEELELHARDRKSSTWHLLAYFPNSTTEQIEEFRAWLEPLADDRAPRMKQIIAKLAEHGMDIEFDEVDALASGSIGRPHLAAVMVDKGYCESIGEAFEKWIGDGGPCYVKRKLPTISQAVERVKLAGGITSLAHPIYYGVSPPQLLAYIEQCGVDCIEAIHRSHMDGYRFQLIEQAKAHGIAITVGSDYHGPTFQSHPGKMNVITDYLPEAIKL